MRRARALVLGSGVAGLTCAYLLQARGWLVDCATSKSTPGPMVVISRSNAELLLELWRADESLFRHAHRLSGRVVHWESMATPSPSTAPALAMPIDGLTSLLRDRAEISGLRFVDVEKVDLAGYAWVIEARGRKAALGHSMAFGCRRALAAPVSLMPCAHTDRTVMESVPGGWLFLIPHGLGRGTLQAVFRNLPVEAGLLELLGRSRIASTLVEEIADEPSAFTAMPRLANVPCIAGSIAVGDAALALDPLSGNGIGSGLRSAILAAAVLEAAEGDAVPQACFDHYARRLRDAMRRHVRMCIDLYGRAAHAGSWQVEIADMAEGLGRLPSASDSLAFTLNHGRLHRVPAMTPEAH